MTFGGHNSARNKGHGENENRTIRTEQSLATVQITRANVSSSSRAGVGDYHPRKGEASPRW